MHIHSKIVSNITLCYEYCSTCLELLEKGASPNILAEPEGVAPIHLAVGLSNLEDSKQITEAMMALGGNPNVRYKANAER